ncbi:intradiol ring-cleavage dioxygenase [Microlunatus elymi]|uniref:Intradiol ring-cleavage dioxygenase n=1 Tax=Microlunatus elymi TaxID=2596828 RepID=A0A516PX37_9ACTN|nr:intradiol ring-cleavage dioxygenase [Microlunatus elymi]QDP95740.1 intradiol ring-cleavage dioxygenase [Microlunatus elymi]
MKQRPNHLRYQGRELPRPDEELVDQGLGFDLGTLFDRRRVLALFGAGAAAAGLAACSNGNGSTADAATGDAATGSSGGLTEIPDETAGPYPGDGSNGPDVLEQSGIVRSDLRSSFGTGSATAEGVPMTLELTILDLAHDNAAFNDVAVYVWHCDRGGNYSMYASGLEDENYLRGVQIADADGKVKFTSIFPACYSGRWPHIHFEVYPDQDSITDSTKAIATSQVALPASVCQQVYKQSGYQQSVQNLSRVSLDSDNVFGDDGGKHQLGTVTGGIKKGLQVSLKVPVDTGTKPTGGSAPQGGGGPGGAPGGAPPSGAPTGAPPSGAPSRGAS